MDYPLGNTIFITLIKMLPFYIETDGLCKVTKCLSFDPKLHEFQLEECYGRWFEEISSSPSIDASPEIFACFFFRQLHRKPTLLHELYLFRYKMSHSTFILIRNVICAFKSNNYRHFFTQFSELEPLLKHSLSDSVASLRQTAIRTISVAFKTPVAKLPSRLVSEWLGFPKNLEHFDTFLRHYNVIPDENGDFLIASIKFVEFTMFDYSTRQYE
uniref:SAC3/GANP/THP3 conserved domain-containing protein n=1 Tax=Caenorhabditis japonica TaxID=281687 RepID=A0A8R1DFN3_CAEJA